MIALIPPKIVEIPIELRKVREWRQPLSVAIMLVPLAMGTWLSYPLYDDGWMAMMLREQSPSLLRGFMGDRPVFGALLEALTRLGGISPALYVALTVLLWSLFGMQCGWMWRRLFPSVPEFAYVVGPASLATIAVQCQFCTLQIVLPCVVPAVLAQAGLLILLKYRQGLIAPAAAALCLAMGVMVSEYALASAAGSFVILAYVAWNLRDVTVRRWLFASILLQGIVTLLTYGVFLKWAQLEQTRPSVSPMLVESVVRKDVVALAVNLFNGFWRITVGAYAESLGSVRLHWNSKSSIVSVMVGVLLGGFLVWLLRRRVTAIRGEKQKMVHIALALSILVGLLPVVLMGRNAALPEFGSRFLIPVIGFAVLLSISLSLRVMRADWVWVGVLIWGFLCGNSVVSSVLQARREMAFMKRAGEAVQPYVSDSDYTIAVLSRSGMDYEMTARATADWPLNLSTRFWLFDEDTGRKAFGLRHNCKQQERVDVEIRGLKRKGRISKLLWIDSDPQSAVRIEDYCQSQSEVQ